MKNKLILILLLAAGLNVSAKCIPAVEDQYAVLDMAVITGNTELRDSLAEKYCFNSPKFYKEVSKPQGKLFQGVFKSRSVEDLKIYYPPGTSISVFGEGNYYRDLLSFAVSAYHQPRMNEEEVRLGDKYLAKGNKINVNPKKLTTKEHDELMEYIVSAYNKEGYTFTNKSDRNNMFHYIVYANNPKVLHGLIVNDSYRKLFFYRKSIFGVTPLHFAFSEKKPYDESTQKVDTPAMNDLLLDLITKARIQSLTYVSPYGQKVGFFEFAEVLKNENPDFYNKLKKKFNFVVNIPEDQKKRLKPILTKALLLQNVLDSYKDIP